MDRWEFSRDRWKSEQPLSTRGPPVLELAGEFFRCRPRRDVRVPAGFDEAAQPWRYPFGHLRPEAFANIDLEENAVLSVRERLLPGKEDPGDHAQTIYIRFASVVSAAENFGRDVWQNSTHLGAVTRIK